MVQLDPDNPRTTTAEDAEAHAADSAEARFARVSLRYNDMLRSAVDWLWETDAQLNLTYLSPPIATTLGIPAQMLIGRSLYHLFGVSDGDMASSSMAAAIEARRPFRDEQFLIDAGDDVRTVFRVTGVPYYGDDSGRFAGYRGTGTAIPDPRNRAGADPETANQLMDMLEAALSRKDQLEWELSKSGGQAFQSRLASLAHELRTPLNAIIGFAEVIRERHLGEDPARYQDYAGTIHESGLHLLEIINGLLEHNGIDGAARRAGSELLDLTEVVASVLRMVEDKARAAEILLVNNIAWDAPKTRAERRAVRQILINLLTNAIKYTPAGGAVGIESETDGKLSLGVTVWDTGVGIAPDDQDKVFEPSYRVADSGLERPGSGLGLAISRDLARAMGGEITIASQPGEGSRVTLRLPLVTDSEQPPDTFG